jgi:hypothetical protein
VKRNEASLLALVLLSVGAIMGIVVVQDRADLGLLLRDPADTTGSPWYLGVISTLGILGWTVATTLLSVAALVWYRAGERPGARCMAAAGAGTTVLLLDDWLMIHDDWAQRTHNLEVPIFGLFAAGFLAWIVHYRWWLIRGPVVLALVTGAAWAASLVIDVAFATYGDTRLALEEGAKLFGIGTWAAYAALVLWAALDRLEGPERDPATGPAQ